LVGHGGIILCLQHHLGVGAVEDPKVCSFAEAPQKSVVIAIESTNAEQHDIADQFPTALSNGMASLASTIGERQQEIPCCRDDAIDDIVQFIGCQAVFGPELWPLVA
jgi:hypothetical protein